MGFFGPNASGKSTVLKALAFIGWFTRDSFQLAPNAPLPCERFNAAEAQKQPIRLAVEFSGPLNLTIEEFNERTPLGTWRYELVIAQGPGPLRCRIGIAQAETARQGKVGPGL